MENMKVRQAALLHGVKLWEIADRIGLSDFAFSRQLRKELPPEEQDRILKIIEDIAERRETVDAHEDD